MRVSREKAAENRKRVVETSGRLFRERGYEGVGVAELMKSAGLTHGGFYGQFESKEALAAEAMSTALQGAKARWEKRVADNPDAPLKALVDYYLSDRHRDATALSCPIAALASETRRQSDPVRKAFGEGTRDLIDILASTMPEATEAERHQSALVAFSAMVGAVVLARAVDDRTFGDDILNAARSAFARND